jgi:hypothetical protein
MIDHRYRAIFIHQRKCAGSSIITAFGHRPNTEEWDAYNDGVLTLNWDRRDRSYFVFSVVRNPFDRLISGWKYLAATRDRSLLDVLKNPPLKGADYRHLTRPQVAILKDPQSGALATNALIRFENLQDDFNGICDRIGARRVVLPCLNRSARMTDYRQYFDGETRRLAEAMFADDIETFQYSF